MKKRLLIAILLFFTSANCLFAFDKQGNCFELSQNYIWSCVAGGTPLWQCTQQANTVYCECMNWQGPGCGGQ
jgi:hypothetical protein